MGYNFQAYAKQAVPRYTSYPTAPHFTSDVGSDDYAGWLSRLKADDPLSLYLHVPYCRALCWYCGCNMKLASKKSPISAYAKTLAEEVRLVASHLPDRMKVGHLHWGGGTPTALEPDDLARVMDEVHACYDVLPDAELAIESDPRHLPAEMIDRIGALGFTRASFGVQEFDASVQMAINRVQPPNMVRRAVDGLRDVGVEKINFDLIYGLPHQTVETLEKTIAICVEMKPDRIALFGYAHVPWMAKKQRLISEAALPDQTARIAQASAAAKALVDAGYVAIGLDHFARPDDTLAIAAEAGTLRRNFQGYTTDTAKALLGMGCTSIGKTPDGFVQNIRDTRAWTRAVEEGALPVAKGCAVSDDDAMRAEIIEALMCQGTVNLCDVSLAHGIPTGWLANVEDELVDLELDGIVQREGQVLTIVEDARHLVRVVAAVFDAYRKDSVTQHSVAV
jgi:oxygen-independent coproporphyrinogen-3 oxidase